MFDLIFKNVCCFLPKPQDSNQVVEEELDLGIKNGRIAQIGSLYKAKTKKEISFKGLHVLPGLIDTQVHFREPGLEYKEDIYHGSLSAIKGGITAFFEMPNTFPPTATIKDIEDKIERAEKKSWCDFAFYLGAVKENKNQLVEWEGTRACPGVKIFLGHSTGNLVLEDEESLRAVFKNRKRITAIHSEDESRLRERRDLAYRKPLHARNHPLWRDAKTCLISTQRVVSLARKYKVPIHILHVTTWQEIEFLSQHKDLVSVEVTPQHLSLSAPECYDTYGSLVQMNPPIRDKKHQEALWKGIQSGVVDIIGSDHAPHTWEEKEKAYPDSPSGMPGVQTLLPLLLNHVNQGRLDLKRLVQLLAHNPSQRFGLKDQGQIKESYKANFTVIDLKRKQKIERKWLASKCAWSPFEGWEVKGWPVFTFLNGEKVMEESEVLGKPKGQRIEFNK
ncbi:MAG: dihydroorotase [Bdellovibrionales bacterium]|nr:dihydroorotase [Bdellovibrionales bacterium]